MERRMKAIKKNAMKAMPRDVEESGGSGAYSVAQSQVYVETSGSGRAPRVYKESTVARAGPGGVKELQREVYDNTKGRQLTTGRCLGDRGHVMTREMDTRGVTVTENQDLYNLSDEEGEVDRFHREWEETRNRYLPPPLEGAGRNGGKSLPHVDGVKRNGKGGKYLTKK